MAWQLKSKRKKYKKYKEREDRAPAPRNPRCDIPEKDLLVALLERTAMDLTTPGTPIIERKRAAAWVLAPDRRNFTTPSAFSFAWVCLMANINTQWRNRLENLARNVVLTLTC